jgi:AcrR family transcriptional regulator
MTKAQRAERRGQADRRTAVNGYRRQIILDAARRVFAEQGLEGASLRTIAKAAGYTHGALYFHYASKEEIYGDLLSDSLDRLHAAVRAAVGARRAAGPRLQAAALGFFDYYRANPGELELGFYLFRGMKPLGLTRELNARLNAKLRAVLAEMEAALGGLSLAAPAAERETAALFAHAAGLLLLEHTGRLRLFRADARQLMSDYVARLATDRDAEPPNRAVPRRRK